MTGVALKLRVVALVDALVMRLVCGIMGYVQKTCNEEVDENKERSIVDEETRL